MRSSPVWCTADTSDGTSVAYSSVLIQFELKSRAGSVALIHRIVYLVGIRIRSVVILLTWSHVSVQASFTCMGSAGHRAVCQDKASLQLPAYWPGAAGTRWSSPPHKQAVSTDALLAPQTKPHPSLLRAEPVHPLPRHRLHSTRQPQGHLSMMRHVDCNVRYPSCRSG